VRANSGAPFVPAAAKKAVARPTAAAVERRSQPKCLVVLPVTKATLVVGEQSEVKFEPGIECALERYQRL
jgi:hypothetical protein